ncbi:FAD-dependent 5-carboxymethylaminomethyl-2-thiouridine(34) oxidoreductase MnmC [Pusillimonas sp.]|uniref:FAD-dependent 5-carboxymethylaminomethyl-2-thiouridine(34) oxidoreductase MnmC n=1 Tax=Pusillimonas sp. TaxID=3040095 RepID=UPI0029BA5660|nr:FAD-dependent 5-carboxymethylaminomethyl-2-thiouridine(34) oxidoreductase MnmC [Pusillimonas sp.]MDX3895999.1 FAD-dependent 5-carboxymethylaminomethyl-2-thiouridine(34) oxidoreductase MnmC [Pusillimonas sp.]
MSGRYAPLVPASLSFDATGTPFSERHQDVYHARQGAMDQARHVFLRGNGLPERWRGKASFTVCETGFGLGRNFLALWQAWRDDPQRCGRLHMLSFEAHPFSAADLAIASRGLPAGLHEAAGQLVQAWPVLLPGVHRLEFEGGRLTLTLVFGRIEHTAREAQAGVDAFFLDGFAPAVNPEMWSPALSGQLVRLARPGATAATWCASGEVRRALRDAGFLVGKAPGFGGKWNMIRAVLRPGLGRGLLAAGPGPVLVVGAGPAGAGMAHALAARGRKVLVADPVLARGRGASHRGHLAAALTPLVSRDDDLRARLSRAGVLRALHRWQSLPEAARPRRLGTVELLRDAAQEEQRRLTLETLRFPEEWVRWMDAGEVSRRAGLRIERPGIFFADGQLVRPEPLLEALLDHACIDCRSTRIQRLQRDGDGWLAQGEDGEVFSAATVVLANATDAAALLSTCMDLSRLPKLESGWRLAGQVSYFRSAAAGHDPATVLSADGYWLPEVEGVNVGGSTYLANAPASEVTVDGHHAIAEQVAGMLGVGAGRVEGWLDERAGWAGWRAVVAGRLPVFGPVSDMPGLWLACAYGSRGLTWAALAGDLLAATLEGEPLPLERSLQAAVAPR